MIFLDRLRNERLSDSSLMEPQFVLCDKIKTYFYTYTDAHSSNFPFISFFDTQQGYGSLDVTSLTESEFFFFFTSA